MNCNKCGLCKNIRIKQKIFRNTKRDIDFRCVIDKKKVSTQSIIKDCKNFEEVEESGNIASL